RYLGFGEQPRAATQPGVPVAPFDPLERLRAFHFNDGIEVHGCALDGYLRSSSEVGPGPGVISAGHWCEPNGTAGGRKGCFPRRCISEMMVLRASPPISSKSINRSLPKNSEPTARSEMMRVSEVSISCGVVVNEIVSISSNRSLTASGGKYWASVLNST